MISVLKVLYKTNDAFDDLDKRYEDELDRNSFFIFVIFGAISGVVSFFRDMDFFKELTGNGGLVLLWIVSGILGAGLFILIGRYLFTYVIYGIGRILKGPGKVIDIRTVVAYSMIPLIFEFLMDLLLGLSERFFTVNGIEIWIENVFSFLVRIWILKIMLQGGMRFNNFRFGKALLAISPIFLSTIVKSILVVYIKAKI